MDERNKEADKKIVDFVYWALTGLLVLAVTYAAGPQEEMKLALYGILLLIALFIWWARGAVTRRKEAATRADEHQEEMITEIREGFKGLSTRVDNLQDAQSSTMRTQLIHYAEKYLERGWFTPEEHESWHDMHKRYSKIVGENGFIDSYKRKLDALPEKELDSVIAEYQEQKKHISGVI